MSIYFREHMVETETAGSVRPLTYRITMGTETVTGNPLFVATDILDAGVVGYAPTREEAIDDLVDARRAVDTLYGKPWLAYMLAEFTEGTQSSS